MVVERKARMDFWVSALLNSIPDIVIAVAVAVGTEGGWFAFVAAYFGLQGLYLLIWLKNTIWSWLRFMMIDKKRAVQLAVDRLYSAKFPPPDEYLSTGDDYLAGVMQNDAVETTTRLAAASDLGVVQYLRSTTRMQEGLKLHIILDAAVEEYGRAMSRSAVD